MGGGRFAGGGGGAQGVPRPRPWVGGDGAVSSSSEDDSEEELDDDINAPFTRSVWSAVMSSGA